MASKRIVLAGGSGFVGQALAGRLLADGYEVIVLSRGGPQGRSRTGPSEPLLPGMVRRVGEWASIAGRRRGRRQSDRQEHQLPADAVQSPRDHPLSRGFCPGGWRGHSPLPPPAAGLRANGGGWNLRRLRRYRFATNRPRRDGGFLGETCRQWEKAFEESPTPGVRRVVLRLGVVLGPRRRGLSAAGRLTRWFLGGAAGRGRQYISWLHLADAVRIYREAIDREDFQGIYVAARHSRRPTPSSCASCVPSLHRPWSPPVPAVAVRLGGWIAGINADLALVGQRCAPRRLMEQGFAYEFPDLRRALAELVG